MKFQYLILLLPFMIGCGGTKYVDYSKLPDTYLCTYMKDVCKEAQDFETKYRQMSPEEKEEFKTVLQSYRLQCNDALDACQKSR
ncbi:MAG: hypothetical protein GX640_22015 [Fibrobacter sp.]|nr:hypothetical protein [Fibrobacter sp.]